MPRTPALPTLLNRKIYKTGQTRGADDDVIYQNRVGRNSTVLIPYDCWNIASHPPEGEKEFEKGYIALIQPKYYFTNDNIQKELLEKGLSVGINALIFYGTRTEWTKYNPDSLGWKPANSRQSPLGGQYVARVPGTTATQDGERITRGFTTTRNKGAGIRVYEYASMETIKKCRLQLELLFWLCIDSEIVAENQGMNSEDIKIRKNHNIEECNAKSLFNIDQIISHRLINANHHTICPLCLEEVSAMGFINKVEQAEGRSVPNLTVTQLNLFHIEELRIGKYGHRPYNLGWGHHHCNVVVKDSGIMPTLTWMDKIVGQNIELGYFISSRIVE